jgi:ADP-heptose:LPS heptosyltransferase
MFNRLKGILYDVVLWLATKGKRQTKKHQVLIVKTDEIGDYILWRNFLSEMVNADRFQNYEIHFCGNKNWKNIFEKFDQKHINQSYWLDKLKFKKNLFYRFRFLRSIYLQGFSLVINPIFSRDKRNDDSIVRSAKSPQAIGMQANRESMHPYEEGYDKSIYTELFKHAEQPIFEFYRNKYFNEFIIQHPSNVVNTAVPINLLPKLTLSVPENYMVIFPGSRNKNRIWPIENFVQLANYFFEKYALTVVVCGAGNDKIYTQDFVASYQNPLIDLTNKTTLLEMLSLLVNAYCLVSVDTGAVHLAAAVGCPVFAIFNGSQYKRFGPYPKEIADHFYAFYPDEVESDFLHFDSVKEKYEFVINTPYSSVSPDKIISFVKSLTKNNDDKYS